jgi:SAM-dependent methyltransferase
MHKWQLLHLSSHKTVFVKSEHSEYTEVDVSDLPFYCSSIEGQVLLSHAPIDVSTIDPFVVMVSKNNRATVVALSIPAHLVDQAWRSRSSETLLVEIHRSLLRLGYFFEYVTSDETAGIRMFSGLGGRWFGWRNFSTRAKARMGGIADSGTVLAETLEVLGGSMPRYADWLTSATINPKARRVLEIGAGTGTMTVLYGKVAAVVAVEPSADARRALEMNTRNFANITVCESLSDAKVHGEFDHAVLVNVLEHVEYDVKLLREARLMLAKGGTLTVLSPAHNILYSRFDASIGHVRRYTKHTLTRSLEIAGFGDVQARYFNATGALFWLFINRLLGKLDADESQTSLYDKIVVPISSGLDRIRIRPFGQSVVATATNTSASDS